MWETTPVATGKDVVRPHGVGHFHKAAQRLQIAQPARRGGPVQFIVAKARPDTPERSEWSSAVDFHVRGAGVGGHNLLFFTDLLGYGTSRGPRRGQPSAVQNSRRTWTLGLPLSR